MEIFTRPPTKTETDCIFDIMHQLKGINPGDTWLDNYSWHLNKNGENFLDFYHFARRIGFELNPKNILEIGCRSGISICQLLTSCQPKSDRKVYLCDLFNDGLISPELVKMNLRHLGIQTDSITFFEGPSERIIPKIKKDEPNLLFDYILVDGSHDRSDAYTDLKNVESIVSIGGIILFDDIAPDGCGLIDVWDKWKSEHTPGDFKYFETMIGKGCGVAIKQ